MPERTLPDPIVEVFRRQLRADALARTLLAVGMIPAYACTEAQAFPFLRLPLWAPFVTLALAVHLHAARRSAREAYGRGPRHTGILVAHGPSLHELRTDAGAIWIRGPHVEHATDLRPRALLRALLRGGAPIEVLVTGIVQRSSALPPELVEGGSYRAGAGLAVIEGTLEHPVWIFTPPRFGRRA